MSTDLRGLARGDVRLVPYDPAWPQVYEQAAAELLSALGSIVCSIEHTGSTAVAGLDAKPIIDLIVSVRSLALTNSFFATLAIIGYEHRRLDAVPGRQYFIRGSEDNRTHSVSVCEHDSAHWHIRLRFRDRLREDTALGDRYRALKYRLAEAFPRDRIAYTEGKADFIARVVS